MLPPTPLQVAAVGLGLERDAIASLMRNGPHLLAPTGSDLAAHGEPGAVLAGWVPLSILSYQWLTIRRYRRIALPSFRPAKTFV